MTSVVDVARDLGLTRLTHFTPSKNLPHIFRDGMLRSSKDLAANAPDYFSPTDTERFDNHPEMLCCSLEYPNGYYLAKARQKGQFTNFRDWVCLTLDIELLSRPGVLFSPCNAARGSGAYLQGSVDGLRRCYASPSDTGYERGSAHRRGVPTDLQAEALVPGPVGLRHVRSIVVPAVEAAVHETERLLGLRLDPDRFAWYVSPIMFMSTALASRLRSGVDIQEERWVRSPDE